MQRIGKKIFRYFLRTVLFLVILVFLGITACYIYINSTKGRVTLASEISKTLTSVMGVEVLIGDARWSFPADVVLNRVVIKDHRHNNMFVLNHVEAGLAFYDFVTKRITFSTVVLDTVNFDLVRYKGDSNSNFGYVIAKLSQTTDTTHKAPAADIMFNAVNLKNLHFTWNDQNQKTMPYAGLDWNHLDIPYFNGRFTYLWINGNDVSAKIKQMSLKERSGFEIRNMEAIASYSPTTIEVKSFHLLTNHSDIGDHIKLTYKNTDELVDFINKVDMEGELNDSKVSFKDLAYFTPDLKDKTDSVMVSNLEVTGKVNDMHVSNIEASFGKRSYINGKAELKGLPNINETFIAVRLKQSRTSKAELERLMPEIILPGMITKLGEVTLKGNFTGFINDFVTYGEFNTALGEISTDVNLKLTRDSALSTYSGKLQMKGFDIGKLTEQPLLGKVTMNGQVDGKGLTLNSVRARLVATLQEFDFNQYSYHDLSVNGDASKKFFSGSLGVKDKNLSLDFKGTVDYTQLKPDFNFLADVRYANLYALNLSHDSLSLSSLIKINLHGINPDDIDGRVIARNTKLFLPGTTYAFDSVEVNSTVADHYREINIFSDILLAKISGDFKLSQMGDLLKSTANKYVDSSFLHLKATPPKDQFVNFDINFLDLSPVFSILRTKVDIADSGYLKGSIYSNGYKVKLEGSLPNVKYNALNFKNIKINGTGDNNYLTVGLSVGALFNKDSMVMRDARVKIRSNTDKLWYDIYAADQLKQKQAYLKGTFDVENKMGYLDFDSSRITLPNNIWNITSKQIVFYKDTMMDVPLFTMTNGKQNIKLIGKYSKKNSYPIRIIIENVGLASVGTFVPEISAFSGDINGQVLINEINTKPIFEAALYVSPLMYQHDTLGILTTATSYNENTRKLNIETKLENKNQDEVATAKGDITIDQKQELALDVNLNKTDIKIFEPFINTIFSELKGQATANMKITGTAMEPDIKGSIAFADAELKVNYLNTKYHFNHKVTFGGRVINIKNLDMYDVNNNLAVVSGKFDLSRLNNVKMNLDINTKKFQVLNTTQKINDLYFGRAFATGYANISGPLDNLKFNIRMKTEKGTTFSMPISQGNTFYGHEYIKFINRGNYLKSSRDVRLSGVQLNMDLEITPDAFGQIIFDPRVGDIIEAHGNGNLRLEVNTDGDFSMFGTYTISDGRYRFTAFDIINKSFVINPGSTIAWNGSPYEAQLNVQAIYTIRTTLQPLIVSGSVDNKDPFYLRTFPVDAKLNLKGSLFQPEIKLDFEIRELYNQASEVTDIDTRVRQIKNNEQDLNQQVVSLLVLNQFAPVEQGVSTNPSIGDAINSGLNSSVGDLVSSQVNYWLSKISEDVHVGVDYRKQEEFTLRVSTDIFKQRANISGSYDVTNNNYNTQLSYKIRPEGDLQGKVFSRSNNSPLIGQNSSTIGVGVIFRREFDKVGELFKKRQKKVRPKL